jgi:hypothetical protein
LHAYLQAKVDPEFDACLATLGSISKHTTTLAINSLMAWRDSAGDLPELVVPAPMAFSSIRGGMRGPVKSTTDTNREIRLVPLLSRIAPVSLITVQFD